MTHVLNVLKKDSKNDSFNKENQKKQLDIKTETSKDKKPTDNKPKEIITPKNKNNMPAEKILDSEDEKELLKES